MQSHFVVISQVLPADNTIGYDDFAYLIVQRVNGREIKSLGDLAEAVKQPVDGFIKIETEEDPKQLELDAAQVEAEAARCSKITACLRCRDWILRSILSVARVITRKQSIALHRATISSDTLH